MSMTWNAGVDPAQIESYEIGVRSSEVNVVRKL